MRIVIVLLLFANFTLWAYTRLDTGNGEGILLQDQVQPDKIKLLSPQQVAALGPAKVAALADVCVEWGPLSDPDRARALTELEPLALGRLVSQRRVDFDSGFSITTGPFPTRSAADARVVELRKAGVKELAVAEGQRGQFVVSFGNFRSEVAAIAYADELARLGMTTARVERRVQPVSQTVLVIRDPPQPVVARLRELAAQHAGSDLRTTACERTS